MTDAVLRSQGLYAQGARCGHIDGKARCGVYVLAEEYDASDVAAVNARTDYRSERERLTWTRGYREGYRLGAAGYALAAEVEAAALP